jgi:hypothetical protein
MVYSMPLSCMDFLMKYVYSSWGSPQQVLVRVENDFGCVFGILQFTLPEG